MATKYQIDVYAMFTNTIISQLCNGIIPCKNHWVIKAFHSTSLQKAPIGALMF